MNKRRGYVIGLVLLPMLVASAGAVGRLGFVGSYLYQFQAGDPIVIGDYVDPFRYNGEDVRPLEGEGFLDVDPYIDQGSLVIELQTTEESGPLVIAKGIGLQGSIRLEMDRFVNTEPFMQGGIAEYLFAHGDTGVMSAAMPEMFLDLAGWGMIDVYVNGELLYEDLVGHFMLGDRVRRGPEEAYSILRSSDNLIYSPDLEDKTGFTFSGEKELHLFIANSLAGIESTVGQSLALHLNLLLREQVVTFSSGGGGGSSTTSNEPEEEDGGEDDGGTGNNPKGNNGIGNGEDPQPPGNPPKND